MIDIKLIRDNPDTVQAAIRAKNRQVEIKKILKLDEELRGLTHTSEQYRAEKKVVGVEIANTKDKAIKQKLLADMRAVDEKESALKPRIDVIAAELEALLREIPNMATADVKVGKDESENEIIRVVGSPTKFSFTPKS